MYSKSIKNRVKRIEENLEPAQIAILWQDSTNKVWGENADFAEIETEMEAFGERYINKFSNYDHAKFLHKLYDLNCKKSMFEYSKLQLENLEVKLLYFSMFIALIHAAHLIESAVFTNEELTKEQEEFKEFVLSDSTLKDLEEIQKQATESKEWLLNNSDIWQYTGYPRPKQDP